MTYSRIEPGYARIMKLAMDADFPQKVEEWKDHLDEGRMTTEMRDIFAVMGYPLPKPDRRRKHPVVSEPVDTSEDGIAAQVVAAAEDVVRFPRGDEIAADDGT